MSERAVRELLNDVITVSERMAVKLDELSSAATEAGSPLGDLQELLKEWHEVYKKTGRDWISQVSNSDDGELPAGLASLGKKE